MARVLTTPQAELDLVELWSYVAENSIDGADRLLNTIHETCQRLAEFPEMGRERNELVVYLRSFAVGKYVIFYQSIEDGCEVLRVLHGARDIQSVFNVSE